MGLLDFDGEPLHWNQIEEHISYVKKHGLMQFMNSYNQMLKRPREVLKWGDEIEYIIAYFDHENKKVHLSLRGNEVCHKLQEKEREKVPILTSLWRPEYAAFVVEGTPGVPYIGYMAQFNVVEANMKIRRKEIQAQLLPNEEVIGLTNFPMLGCVDFTKPTFKSGKQDYNPVSRSIFFPDEAISEHPRFSLLTRSIRERKGRKVSINIPIFKDEKTPSPFIEDFDDEEAREASKPDHIYMDCMGFGMGCCCLQLTFQACDLTEARFLYDQLAVLCPIMMSLSASSPFYRGYISDIDVRWQVIAASVDDRTPEEQGKEPLKKNSHVIRKSRYDSIDSYLSPEYASFNDVDLEINQDAYQFLKSEGIDEALSKHIAHLWIRDPLTLFSNKIDVDDEKDYGHFENIQSTNWQSMRFKPPPPNSSIGWRVEFRVLDAQLTDFENAAFAVFIVLLTRVILTYKLDFIIPISCVDKNMDRAQKNDAARKEKFYFRKNITTSSSPECCDDICSDSSTNTQTNGTSNNEHKSSGGDGITTDENKTSSSSSSKCSCPEMSLDVIMNGKNGVFIGLIPLVRRYLDSMEVSVQARCSIQEYLKLLGKRASGEYMTTAQWMRKFVRSHPQYKFDSKINDTMAYDLLRRCLQIERGEFSCPELFGAHVPKHKSEYVLPCGKIVNMAPPAQTKDTNNGQL